MLQNKYKILFISTLLCFLIQVSHLQAYSESTVYEPDLASAFEKVLPEMMQMNSKSTRELMVDFERIMTTQFSNPVEDKSEMVLLGKSLPKEFYKFPEYDVVMNTLNRGMIIVQNEHQHMDLIRISFIINLLYTRCAEELMEYMAQDSILQSPQNKHLILYWCLVDKVSTDRSIDPCGNSLREVDKEHWNTLLVSPNAFYRLLALKKVHLYADENERLEIYEKFLFNESISFMHYEAIRGLKNFNSERAVEILEQFLDNKDNYQGDNQYVFFERSATGFDFFPVVEKTFVEVKQKNDFLSNGISHYKTLFGRKSYSVVEVDLKKTELSLLRTNKQGRRLVDFESVQKEFHQEGKDVLFITNGGIFSPQYIPNGLYVEKGELVFPLNLKEGNGNFYMKPNGVFMIENSIPSILASEEYARSKPSPTLAIQSGPLLLLNGQIHSVFNKYSKNLFVRSGIGVKDSEKIIFVLSNEPVSFYELSSFYRNYLKCQEALYLDGVISQFYYSDENNDVKERPYGSYFVVNQR